MKMGTIASPWRYDGPMGAPIGQSAMACDLALRLGQLSPSAGPPCQSRDRRSPEERSIASFGNIRAYDIGQASSGSIPRLAVAREHLDDDHASATARARARQHTWRAAATAGRRSGLQARGALRPPLEGL
jgi:hypothetical protein